MSHDNFLLFSTAAAAVVYFFFSLLLRRSIPFRLKYKKTVTLHHLLLRLNWTFFTFCVRSRFWNLFAGQKHTLTHTHATQKWEMTFHHFVVLGFILYRSLAHSLAPSLILMAQLIRLRFCIQFHIVQLCSFARLRVRYYSDTFPKRQKRTGESECDCRDARTNANAKDVSQPNLHAFNSIELGMVMNK